MESRANTVMQTRTPPTHKSRDGQTTTQKRGWRQRGDLVDMCRMERHRNGDDLTIRERHITDSHTTRNKKKYIYRREGYQREFQKHISLLKQNSNLWPPTTPSCTYHYTKARHLKL